MSILMRSAPVFRAASCVATRAQPIRALYRAQAVRSFAVQVGSTRYTKEHEWVRVTKEGEATVGITDYAQSQLGDVVFVDLPEAGATFSKGDAFGSVESVKAASSVYAPVSLTVSSVNQAVKDDNSLVNASAEKDGWMLKVKLNDVKELDALLDQAAYDKLVADSKH